MKSIMTKFISVQHRYQSNDFDALNAELWAYEALRQLDPKLRIAPLVNRDYSGTYARFNETINLHRTNPFAVGRKVKGTNVSYQDASTTGDTAVLNQQLQVAFKIEDIEQEASFADLAAKFMPQAMRAIAKGIDSILMGQVYQFLDNAAGHIGTALDYDDLLELNKIFQKNEVPSEGRNLIIGAEAEAQMLAIDQFIEVSKFGPNTSIKNGQIGRATGFDIMVASQAWEVTAVNDTTVTTLVNNVGGYPKGTTTLAVDGGSTVVVGAWVKITGDDKPHRLVTGTDVTGACTSIVIDPPLFNAVADDAVVKYYTPFAVNFGAGYAAGYSKEIVYDGATLEPTLGQGISIGAAGAIYTIIGIDQTANTILLDRPLEAAAADDAIICPIPPANYNFAFIADALTFLNRPMRPKPASQGVQSFTAAHNGIAIRVNISNDDDGEATKFIFSTLCGVKVLNTDMGGVLLC